MDEQKQDKILTIPNMMSLFRTVLIPFILLTYRKEMRMISLLLLALSWLTDILDGQIARRFHMISSLGKALDPVADKLTQDVYQSRRAELSKQAEKLEAKIREAGGKLHEAETVRDDALGEALIQMKRFEGWMKR